MMARKDVPPILALFILAIYVWQYFVFADPKMLRDMLWIVVFAWDRFECKK